MVRRWLNAYFTDSLESKSGQCPGELRSSPDAKVQCWGMLGIVVMNWYRSTAHQPIWAMASPDLVPGQQNPSLPESGYKKQLIKTGVQSCVGAGAALKVFK